MSLKFNFTIISIITLFSFVYCDAHSSSNPINLYQTLILEYFQSRHIDNAIMFLCWPVPERVKMVKLFSEYNMRTSFPSGKHKKSRKDLDELFRIQSTKVGVVFDSCCYDGGAPFFQKYTYFNASYVWIILDCGHFVRSLNYLKTLPLLITTDLILTKFDSDSKMLALYDIYHTGFERGGEFNTTYIGAWSPCLKNKCDYEWKKYFLRSKVVRRCDLNGLIIKTVVLIEDRDDYSDVHGYLMDETDMFKDAIFKMNYRLILLLKKMYNFTIVFVMANNWNDKNSKGFYQSGNLMGILADKKADIMAASLQVTKDGVEIADMLYFTYPFRCGFIFRYQGDFGEIKSSFLAPFDNKVWFSFIAIIVTVIIVVWCILLFENKYILNIHKAFWSLSDTVLSIIGACCQMGSEVNPVTSASRLAYFIFFFTCLVLYNFYTSSIVSSLLNYRSKTFDIKQLADSPLECGAMDIGYAHYMLFDVPNKHEMQYFNSRKKTDEFYLPVDEGIQYVKEGDFAYHAEYNTIYNLIENTFEATEICELQEIDTIPDTQMAMFAMKYSQYSEMFRLGLTKAAETGHLKRLQDRWLARKPLCQTTKTFTEVSIHQITPSHVVLYVGFALSFVLLFLEKRKWYDYTEAQKNL